MRHWTFVLMGWLCVTAPFGAMTVSGQTGRATAGEIERLERRVAELEAANTELERRLSRYKDGLEEAVAELNRVRGRGRPRPSAADEGEPGGRSTLETGNRLLSRPRTTVGGGRATVTGEVKNTRPEPVHGTLVIELLRDGEIVDEARVPFAVPPYGLATYERTFELEGWAAGHYSARAGMAY